ncbi:MAG: hypothetical protein R3277_05110 [Brumimicrobium sp.]|nr:hypothetical protein [Brumimicrobium sp.]
MTKTEAKIFFPFAEGEDPEELWEQRFFEQKQFFLTRPPMEKVFKSRISKLQKQYEAYLVLGGEEVALQAEMPEEEIAFSDSVLVSFRLFHDYRNKFKSKILQAQHPEQLAKIIDVWTAMERKYHALWSNDVSKSNETEVALSKEPDPMEVLKAIKEFGGEELMFSELHARYALLPEILQNEVKRLTLLSELDD